MDGLHDRAGEKEKIKELLRDAIRILCQNTVSHRAKLSVEALIGITVDDGEDSIIVSINELISAAETEAYQTDEYGNGEADASYLDYSDQETAMNNGQFNNSIGYGQQHKPVVPYQAIMKTETSMISYNVGQYDAMSHNSITSNPAAAANQYFAADGPYTGYEAVDYGHQAAMGRGQVMAASRGQRGRGRGQVAKRAPKQKTTSVRSVPMVKQEVGGGGDMTPGGEMSPGGMKCSVETGEVSQVTLYTCQRCGKQLNNASSFLRHKKSHLGIVYRCDGCGKILSRSDHLKAHRRNCAAALQQAPLDI